MEIQKVFSDYYDTERMYSVLMSEDELRLFALRDYADLTKKGAEFLRRERSKLAADLSKERSSMISYIPEATRKWNTSPVGLRKEMLRNNGFTGKFNPNWSAREAFNEFARNRRPYAISKLNVSADDLRRKALRMR